MDTIEQITAILQTHSPDDPVARITVSPWTWLLMNAGGIEHCFIASGFDPDPVVSTPVTGCLPMTIEQDQTEAFRLWDRDGQECDSQITARVSEKRSRES